MVSHMKTTLNIDDTVMSRVKTEAANKNVTMAYLVESALRRFLDERPEDVEIKPLPVFDGGGFLVDIDDREALYRAMEEDD